MGNRPRGHQSQFADPRVLRARMQQSRSRYGRHIAAGRPNGPEGVRLHQSGRSGRQIRLHVHAGRM